MLRQRLIKIARNQAPEVGPKRPTAIRKVTDKSEPTPPELFFAKGSNRLASSLVEPFLLPRIPPLPTWGLDVIGAFKKPTPYSPDITSVGKPIVPLREAVSDDRELVWNTPRGGRSSGSAAASAQSVPAPPLGRPPDEHFAETAAHHEAKREQAKKGAWQALAAEISSGSAAAGLVAEPVEGPNFHVHDVPIEHVKLNPVTESL